MIAIVDYGMGNLGSILNMLKKVGATAVITSDPAELQRADKVILPGVGAFDHAMKNLAERGLIPILNSLALDKKIPVFGVCLGMQLLSERSEEGTLPGLGWIKASTKRFAFGPENQKLKIPHMGWNEVSFPRASPLFQNFPTEPRFYFVHSYHVVCDDPLDIAATATYGIPFTAAVQHGNIFGAQFHPDKSHTFGMAVYRNFSQL